MPLRHLAENLFANENYIFIHSMQLIRDIHIKYAAFLK